MYRITIQNLGFSWPDGRPIFHDLSFTIHQEKTGLVGDNGCGKSTLLNLIRGVLRPSSGRIEVVGKVAMVHQTRSFDRSRTVEEFLGAAPKLRALRRILQGDGSAADLGLLDDDWDIELRLSGLMGDAGLAGIDMERPLQSLSGGELSRLALVAAWWPEPDLVLLDEPTNHLDADSRLRLQEFLAKTSTGVLVVSHDRALLRDMDAILELGPGGLRRYGGNFDAYQAQKEAEQAAALAAYEAARTRLKKQEENAREVREKQEKRTANAAHRAKGQNLDKAVLDKLRDNADKTQRKNLATQDQRIRGQQEELRSLRGKVEADQRIRVDLAGQSPHAKKQVLRLENLNYAWPQGKPLWPEPLSFALHGAEKLWLQGPNGSGKSTLVKLIMQTLTPTQGKVQVGVEKVVLLDQDLSLLDPALSLLDNLRQFAPDRMPEHELRTRLARFLFRDDKVFQPTQSLSGGERMRLALACLLVMGEEMELLILDEPTNNLDLRSLEELTAVLAGFEGAMLLITHDAEFAREVGIEKSMGLNRASN